MTISSISEPGKPYLRSTLESFSFPGNKVFKNSFSSIGTKDWQTNIESPPDLSISSTKKSENTLPSEMNINSENITFEPGSYKEYDKLMRQVLVPDIQGNVHEEQLQYAIVYFLLSQKDNKLAQDYLNIFDNLITFNNPPLSAEDATKATLRELVKNQRIPQEYAELVNGISFSSAQLDSNRKALYDNRGSVNDPTIAVIKQQAAINNVFKHLEAIHKGELLISSRSLDAPSNTVPTQTKMPGSIKIEDRTAIASDSSVGFLWKPVSESDGKLAVLLPASLKNRAAVEIHSTTPPDDSNLIEQGRDTHNFHQGRPIYRFSKPGARYPDNCYLVVKFTDQSFQTFNIPNPATRLE